MSRRRTIRAAAVAAVAAVAVVAAATPSLAAGSVTVSPADGLDPAGQVITVVGTGFNEDQGIYVSVCVDNGPGQLPTPCLGGMDTTGESSSSAWVSANPPPYAEGLMIPYGPGGSFEVTIVAIGGDAAAGIDCTVVTCSVVTRSDHTATDDRSQDTRTPLTFAAPGKVSPTASTPAPAAPQSDLTRDPTNSEAATTEPGTAELDAPSTTPLAATEGEDSGGVAVTVWLLVGFVVAGGTVFLVLRSRSREKGSTH